MKFASFKAFIEHLSAFGEKPALVNVSDDSAMSYSQLTREIRDFAATMQGKIQPGNRVLLYRLEGAGWIRSFFGTILIGGVAVPIDKRMSDQMVGDVIDHTKPSIVIAASDIPPSVTIPIVNVKDPINAQNTFDFPNLDGNVPAEIIFTSGTWSKPKGVVLSHNNLLSNLDGVSQLYNPSPNDKPLSILPLAHAYEQMCGLLLPLSVGCTIVYLQEINSRSFITAIKKYGITKIVAVPRILELLRKSIIGHIKYMPIRNLFIDLCCIARFLPLSMRKMIFAKAHNTIGSTLDTFIIGGAPLPRKLDRFFQGLGFTTIVGYGLSETSPVLTISLNQNRKDGEVGIPIPTVNLHPNENGEIVAKGDSVFLGYWPESGGQTEFNTEDLGYLNKQGVLTINGRTKNLVIFPSGDKIFLEDIEKIADLLIDVEESCAVNVGDEKNPILKVIVTTKRTDLETMAKQINSQLPLFARISDVILSKDDTLPRTHTLKLDRKKIQEEYSNIPQ